MNDTCVFCQIVAGTAPADVVREWPDAIAIVPLNPVIEDGHVLVIPRAHVTDAFTDSTVTGATFARAAEFGSDEFPAANLITSVGGAATQTVFHLHVHVVFRSSGDGLPLPWTPQQTQD